MSASPVDASLFAGDLNFEFLPFAVTSDVGPQFLKIAALSVTEVRARSKCATLLRQCDQIGGNFCHLGKTKFRTYSKMPSFIV
jgi:hypothetical protein